MKKILLIAPDFNNYTEIFSNSIDKCGYNYFIVVIKKLQIKKRQYSIKEYWNFIKR